MSQTIKFHWRAMPKIQFTSDLTFSPLISLKSESLVDYSSIESRIMAFRDKLIDKNNFDRFLVKKWQFLKKLKNGHFSEIPFLSRKFWPIKILSKVCHWVEQNVTVTWRICHKREHCRLSADNVSHVRETISCRDLHQDKNLKIDKIEHSYQTHFNFIFSIEIVSWLFEIETDIF